MSRMRKGETGFVMERYLIIFSTVLFVLGNSIPAVADVVFYDGFEGAFPGTNWVIGSNNGNTVSSWGDNKAKAAVGTWSAFCADNGSNLRTTYDNDLNSYMQVQHISLAGYTNTYLRFSYWLNTESAYDYLEVNVRSSSGSWSNVFVKSGDFSSSGWQTEIINLNAYDGQSDIYISFDFGSDGSVTYQGAWIDEVTLTAQGTGSLTTYLRDQNGTLASASGSRMLLYTQPLNQRTGSNPATFSNIPSGTYNFEGYHTGTFWGEEYWTGRSFTIVSNSSLAGDTYREYPYATSVSFKNDATGATISPGQLVSAGTRLRAVITVRNDVTNTSLQSKVRIVLDRNQAGTIDADATSGYQWISGSGGATTYTLYFTPTQTGQYFYALDLTTILANGNSKRTDSWTWTQMARIGAPDISCCTPSGWPNNIVVSNASGNYSQNTIYAGNTAYISWAQSNSGSISTSTSFTARLLVDNVQIKSWTYYAAMSPGPCYAVTDYPYVFNSSGSHTVRIETDYLNNIANEESETNNACEYVVNVIYSDDNYEPNNSVNTAYDLTPYENTWLSTVNGMGRQWDDDWYRINVPVGKERVHITCTFTHSAGDIDIWLTRPDGSWLDGGTTTTDNENIDFTVPSGGVYYVRVYYENQGNNYNLLWNTQSTDDNYEENDSRSTAFDFSGYPSIWLSSINGLGIQADDDWYKIHVTTSGYGIHAECTFTNSAGNINMALYGASGTFIASSATSTDNEVIDASSLAAGDYYLKVYYANQGNTYDLKWNSTAPQATHMQLTESSLSFESYVNGYTAPAQSFVISNTGGGTLSWSVTAPAWIRITSPQSGNSNSVTVNVSIDESSMPAGQYQKTGIITVSSSNADNSPQTVSVSFARWEVKPIFLVHGVVENSDVWGTMSADLTNRGFHYVYAVDNLDPCGVSGETFFSGNASQLADYINTTLTTLRGTTGVLVDRINIVAHSMGGLIARRYMSPTSTFSTSWSRATVDNLVMLGTPNNGSALANVGTEVAFYAQQSGLDGFSCTSGPAFYEMNSLAMKIFNNLFEDNKNTNYFALYGTRGASLDCFYRVPYLSQTVFLGLPNDAAVSRRSAIGNQHSITLLGITFEWNRYDKHYGSFSWCHSPESDHSSSDQNNYLKDPSLVSDYIVPILGGAPPTPPIDLPSSGDPDIPPQVTSQHEFTLMKGFETTGMFTSASGDSVFIASFTDDSLLNFVVQSPSGQVIDSATTASDAAMTYDHSNPYIYYYEIDNAEVGNWTWRLNSFGSTSQQSRGTVVSAAGGSVVADAAQSTEVVAVGDTLVLGVTVTDAGVGVPGLLVIATPIRNSIDTLPSYSLPDNGQNGDAVAGDGLYTATIFNPSISDVEYQIQVLGAAPSGEISRVLKLYTTSVVSSAADSDGDTVPDSLDNCPYTYQYDQLDTDGDGIGNACEVGEIVLDHVVGGANGKLQAETPVTFYLRLNNEGYGRIVGATNGFRVYSPTGATWEPLTYDTLSVTGGWSAIYDLFIGINEFSNTGSGADTVGVGGLMQPGTGTGIPYGFNEQFFKISTRLSALSVGDTICLDTAFYPFAGDWLWSKDDGVIVHPLWYGPYCFEITDASCCDTPGDASNDGSFNITDVTFLIARIFSGGPAPACGDEGDVNGDNSINIADVTYAINRIFTGGAAPVCGTTGS